MKETILAKIKALPPLDDTIIKIQSICMDKNSSLSELTKVIEKDPMLTANILKAANSPLYGFSREVKNVNHAISLFGMSTIRGFALSSAIRQNFKINLSPYNIDNNRFLSITNMQSALMLNWYSKIDRELLGVLVPASFLMEVGKIILAHEVIEEHRESEFSTKIKEFCTPFELSHFEKDVFGFDNECIAAKIFEQWNLEIELVEAIRFSNDPSHAPSHIEPYAKALQIVKSAVNIYEQLSEKSVENALNLIRQHSMDEALFLKAKDTTTR